MNFFIVFYVTVKADGYTIRALEKRGKETREGDGMELNYKEKWDQEEKIDPYKFLYIEFVHHSAEIW